jgi:CHAT domain-containing protein
MLLGAFIHPEMQQLIIVPDGGLDLLPFAALPENGCHAGDSPITATHRIMLAPSLSILLMPHQSRDPKSWRGEVALFADPVFDRNDARLVRTPQYSAVSRRLRSDTNTPGLALPRLFGTRDEAKAIAALAGAAHSALYLDFNASLQTLLNQTSGQYRILHLATHGIFDENTPDLSAIILSLVNKEGQPVPGYLRPHDVESLNVQSDLVVLSSCDSAAGLNLRGEGSMGLTHAFMSAGATRVLSTLWTIDDETSKRLMVDFYTGLLRDGLEPAEALRRSQMKLMRSPATSAPYYWASFVITTTAP